MRPVADPVGQVLTSCGGSSSGGGRGPSAWPARSGHARDVLLPGGTLAFSVGCLPGEPAGVARLASIFWAPWTMSAGPRLWVSRLSVL